MLQTKLRISPESWVIFSHGLIYQSIGDLRAWFPKKVSNMKIRGKVHKESNMTYIVSFSILLFVKICFIIWEESGSESVSLKVLSFFFT